MGRYIPPATWSAIRREWRLGRDSAVGIARRCGVNRSAIQLRAKRENWPRHGSEHDNVVLHAEVILDDVLHDLTDKLNVLRDPESTETLRSAGEDVRHIFLLSREARRAISEVKKAKAECGSSKEYENEKVPLDFDAARKEIMARLDHLAQWIAEDKALSGPDQKAVCEK